MKKIYGLLAIGLLASVGWTGLLGSGVQGISNSSSSGSSGGGSGTPGGSDTQVQFNDAGSFGGDSALVFTKTNGNLGIGTTAPVAKLEVGSGGSSYLQIDPVAQSYVIGDLSASGNSTYLMLDDSTGISTHHSKGFTPITIDGGFVGINNNTPAEAFSVWTASAVPENIALFSDDETVQFGDLNCSGGCVQWEINQGNGAVNVLASGGLSLSQGTGNFVIKAPSLANDLSWTLPTSSGTSGQFLSTNGSGTLTWATAGGGSPGGSSTQVQYNNAGAFGADSGFVYSSSNVGIGSTSPSSKLNIVDSNSTSNVSRKTTSISVTDSGAFTSSRNKKGVYFNGVYSGNFTASGASAQYTGYESNIDYSGTINSSGDGNDATITAFHAAPTFTGSVGDAADTADLIGFNAIVSQEMGTTGTQLKRGLNSQVSGTGDANYAVYAYATGATTNYNIYALGAALNYFEGNVGIGTATPSAKLHTAGTVRFSSFGAGTATFDASGNISSVSDERLKDVKGDFKAGLDQISKIKPILYKWNKKSGLEMESIYAGFSAQNVQKAIPEAVGKNKDGILSLQDRALLAATVNAIKELDARLDVIEKILNLEPVHK